MVWKYKLLERKKDYKYQEENLRGFSFNSGKILKSNVYGRQLHCLLVVMRQLVGVMFLSNFIPYDWLIGF